MLTIPFLAGWASPRELITEEATQLVQEGRDPKWIEDMLSKANAESYDADLWLRLHGAPPRADFAFREPSGLEEIKSERSPGWRKRPVTYSDEVLQDRMLGAWLGRCCGCALGKPVELFMHPAHGLSSRGRVKTYLQSTSPEDYPLNDYFSLREPKQARLDKLWCHPSCRENLKFMESDDDIRYTVLAQQVLRDRGAAFTSGDVMLAWIRQLTYNHVCTAETQAYRNYVLRYHVRIERETDIDWTWVATHQNPYREWIGAQIRADSWGYALPGNPELAAEFAWRDARISHVKNGIYGEMFVAAMIAAAFVLDDPLAVIEATLTEIPQASRLHRDMRETIAICRVHGFQADAFEQVFTDIDKLVGHYHPVHTNNNAALVVAALLLGGRDFEKVITIAVMGGWDTDCNGATAGSIFGAMYGAAKIPAKWKAPLNDTLYSQINEYHPIAISECARRSFDIAKKILTP